MPDYVAGLCNMQDGELVPMETKRITADNDDDAVRQAVEWRVSTFTAVEGRTWLQVLRDGSAIFSKEIGRI
jgi:hypothetical protein